MKESLYCLHFQVRGTHTIEDGITVWAAVAEDGIAILDHQTLQQIAKYSYASVQTFGGALDSLGNGKHNSTDNFMIVVDDCGKKRRLLFGGMSKLKVTLMYLIMLIQTNILWTKINKLWTNTFLLLLCRCLK